MHHVWASLTSGSSKNTVVTGLTAFQLSLLTQENYVKAVES